MAIRFVVFDCMDTLVQMEIPSMEVYPLWAFEAAGDCGIWEGYPEFREDWAEHRRRFIHQNSGLREGTIANRIAGIIETGLDRRGWGWPEKRKRNLADAILRSYWSRYLEATYVGDDVRNVLHRLEGEHGLPLGVLSNFMVPGGIGQILARHDLAGHFRFVLVSCNLGWKKPAEQIYLAAIRASRCSPEEILYVGDNQLADFDGPRLVGMQPLLYDPSDESPSVERRIGSFDELDRWL